MVTEIPRPLLAHLKTMALLFHIDDSEAERKLGEKYLEGLKAALKMGGDGMFEFYLDEEVASVSEFKSKLPQGFDFEHLTLLHKRACLQALHQYFLQNPKWLKLISPDRTQSFIEVYDSFVENNQQFKAEDGMLGYILMLFTKEKFQRLEKDDYEQLACLLDALVQTISTGPYYVVVCGNEGNGMRDFTGKPYPLHFHISPALCGKKEINEFVALYKRTSGIDKTIFIEDGEDLPDSVQHQCYVLPLYITPQKLEEIRGGDNACSLFKEQAQVMQLLQDNQQSLEEGDRQSQA